MRRHPPGRLEGVRRYTSPLLVRFVPADIEWLREEADREGVTAAELVRRAVGVARGSREAGE